MASASTKAASTTSILKPSITLKYNGIYLESISYFPDGQRLISGSVDRTARQWDLKTGKEIEEARSDCEKIVQAVAVSRNGRWVTTAGVGGELKACDVETGIVKTFKGHSENIICIDISAESTQLVSGSLDETVRIWDLETGKLVAGSFRCEYYVSAVRFSPDSKKLAVMSKHGWRLQVWDVQSQKLDVEVGESISLSGTRAPVSWTKNNKNIIAAFSFSKDDEITTIHEFDASTLETVGAPFKGHTDRITGLALSFDDALIASASDDDTIKLWAFESRQLLASFDVQDIYRFALSPDARQLAYAVTTEDDNKIYVCDIPPKILAQARNIARQKANLDHLLHSRATRPPVEYRRPPISIVPRAPPTRDPQQPAFRRLGKLLHFSRANAVPVRHNQPRDPLDVSATAPLPSSLSAQAATQINQFEIGSPPPPSNGVVQSLRQHLPFLVPRHSHGPPVVEVAPGRKFTRLAAAKLPEYKKVDDTRHRSSPQGAMPQENNPADVDSLPDVHWFKAFLCYYSCLSHGRLRMPPRWRLERVDIPRQDGAASGGSDGAQSRS